MEGWRYRGTDREKEICSHISVPRVVWEQINSYDTEVKGQPVITEVCPRVRERERDENSRRE